MSSLSEEMKNFGKVWGDLVASKMQSKNLAKFNVIVDMLSDTDYLDKLFNNKDFSSYREQVSCALARLMLTMGVFDVNESATCQVSSCGNRVTRSRGIFRGSGMCAMHHENHFGHLITKPTLDDFMAEDRTAVPLVEFLSSKDNSTVHSFHFLKAVADFKSISSPKIRLRSVKVIEKKFLTVEAPMKIEDCEKSIAETMEQVKAIDEDRPKTPTSLFKGIETDARQRLSDVFDNEFTKSKQFERFCSSYRLPDELKGAAVNQRKQSQGF